MRLFVACLAIKAPLRSGKLLTLFLIPSSSSLPRPSSLYKSPSPPAELNRNVLHTPYCRSLCCPCLCCIRYQLTCTRSGTYDKQLCVTFNALTFLPVRYRQNLLGACSCTLQPHCCARRHAMWGCHVSSTYHFTQSCHVEFLQNLSVEVGDFTKTSIDWLTNIKAGTEVVLSLVDSTDKEAWSQKVRLSIGF